MSIHTSFTALLGLRGLRASRVLAIWSLLSLSLAGHTAQAADEPAAAASAPAPAASEPTRVCPPAPVPPDVAQMQQGMRDAVDRGFLWKVSRNGRSSWLYGTLHAAKLDWVYPGPAVQQALRDSDVVALEIDVLDPGVAKRLETAVKTPAKQAALPPELAARLATQARLACVDDALAGLRPEMQAVTLSVLVARDEGIDPSWGVDGFLAGYARGLQKPVISLETPELQMALLVSNKPADTARSVAEVLTELESGETRRTLLRLARAWAASEFSELETYAQWCNCVKTAEQKRFYAQLLDGRNGPMARRIADAHQRGQRVFAAVGALHMVGAKSLPALLAAQGFQVERVR